MKRYKVPTGDILILDGDKGKLECLSLGDYGALTNVKADFLNLKADIEGVPNGTIMPLEEKWVVTISTQYGCSMNCKFCDVPKVGPGINATLDDLTKQTLAAIKLQPEVAATKRLNLHYARMGEPTFNPNVLHHARWLRHEIRPFLNRSHVHPVVSTMLPRANKDLISFLVAWTNDIKNDHYRGSAGLQFSINTTDDKQREELFSGNSLSLDEIKKIGDHLPEPKGRKYALNIALADDTIIDAKRMRQLFSPDKFMVKITPMHLTSACVNNKLLTTGGYTEFTPYKQIEDELKKEGFQVLVFVPSYDEDLGRITCGNAILSGTKPECSYEEFNIIVDKP